MKRHSKETSGAKEPCELSYKIEDRDEEYWHEAEKIVLAIYSADEKTPDRNSKVKGTAKKTGRKASKKPVGV